MNFLALAQKVREEAGISGTGPDAVTGQTGDYARILKWVNEAWNEIQTASQSWLWMRGKKEFNTSPSKQTYTPTDLSLDGTIRRWLLESVKIYKLADGAANEKYLDHYDLDSFERRYNLGLPASMMPTGVTEEVLPEGNNIMFGPVPDGEYHVTAKYTTVPTVLEEAGDEPEMPEYFHMAVVYRALMFYGRYDNAPEIYDTAKSDYQALFAKLWHQQRPTISFEPSPLS